MPNESAVDAIVEGFPTPSLPKHSYKTDYSAIKDTHQLLTANVVSIECNLSRGRNGYIGLILPPKQYACISVTAFVLPPYPGRTSHIPE